ncbi:MAG: metallophosphoesterase family protein [Ruminococcus sp.]|nr:metallophosphoesterase family protein [Ruminococcus sp.]
MKTFFISDLHFGHQNCLKFDSRPFDTIEEHDEELIRRWNSVVTDEDEVWVLGDVSWIKPADTAALLHRLCGRKRLIVGNHDKRLLKNEAFCRCFEEIVPYKEIKIEKGLGVVLCHYPVPCFNHRFKGWLHLYGHVHMSGEWDMTEDMRKRFEAKGQRCEMINVGCMLPYMDYMPRTLEEIREGYDAFRRQSEPAADAAV